MRRAFVVVNPVAGRGRAGRLARPIAEAFHARGWTVEVRETERAGGEVDLAAAAARAGWPLVVAAGGDGTVHGAANGLLRAARPETALGVLAVGTGNDFARIVGGTSDVAPSIEGLERGTTRRFDVGEVNGEYFTNSFGIGFDTAVLTEMQRMPALRGSALYGAAVCKAFLAFQPPVIELESDEHQAAAPAMLVEVAIGRSAGGGFRLTPHADPADGLFDVCLIRRVGLWSFLRYMPRLLAARHEGAPPFTMFRTARLRVGTPGRPVVAHLDGELRAYDAEAIETRVVPAALPVRCVT